ncbi:vancomycin high temperature exclusion protein [Flavobacteriaceae bacterium Ap0902]|nr:vancomycin high temperature exclusion protein [Flavobacteriaceae bacterium Ap0902]
MKTFKKIFIFLVIIIFAVLAFIFLAHYTIENKAKGKTFDAVQEIPAAKVGMVLGTAKYLRNGQINSYFKYRIDAVIELYQAQKIAFVLVSGDNGSKYYDEPNDFKDELISRGIPEDKIYLDFAGFRTLDSVVRAKEIFGQKKIIIISQKFHNERAIYLAEENGIKAYGYNARDVGGRFGLKVMLREYLARAKVFWDILFHIEPKYLGEKIEIK